MLKVKKQTFKSTTNNGVRNKVTVTYIYGGLSEDAIIIETKYLVPIDKAEDYFKINQLHPIFLTERETDNYYLLKARTQSLKNSTFDKIVEIVNNFRNE